MGDFQSKRRFRRPYFRLTWVILFLIVLWLGKAVWDIYQKNELTEVNRERAASELASLEERKKNLESKIDRLQTSQGREEEIRRNLPVVKEGEKVIMVVDQPATTTSTTTTPSFWQRWFTFQ